MDGSVYRWNLTKEDAIILTWATLYVCVVCFNFGSAYRRSLHDQIVFLAANLALKIGNRSFGLCGDG